MLPHLIILKRYLIWISQCLLRIFTRIIMTCEENNENAETIHSINALLYRLYSLRRLTMPDPAVEFQKIMIGTILRLLQQKPSQGYMIRSLVKSQPVFYTTLYLDPAVLEYLLQAYNNIPCLALQIHILVYFERFCSHQKDSLTLQHLNDLLFLAVSHLENYYLIQACNKEEEKLITHMLELINRMIYLEGTEEKTLALVSSKVYPLLLRYLSLSKWNEIALEGTWILFRKEPFLDEVEEIKIIDESIVRLQRTGNKKDEKFIGKILSLMSSRKLTNTFIQRILPFVQKVMFRYVFENTDFDLAKNIFGLLLQNVGKIETREEKQILFILTQTLAGSDERIYVPIWQALVHLLKQHGIKYPLLQLQQFPPIRESALDFQKLKDRLEPAPIMAHFFRLGEPENYDFQFLSFLLGIGAEVPLEWRTLANPWICRRIKEVKILITLSSVITLRKLRKRFFLNDYMLLDLKEMLFFDESKCEIEEIHDSDSESYDNNSDSESYETSGGDEEDVVLEGEGDSGIYETSGDDYEDRVEEEDELE